MLTKLVDNISKTYKHEEQLTEFSSKFPAYETCLDKLIISNAKKIETAIIEHDEILNTRIDTNIDDLKAEASRSINQTFSPPNSKNYHSSSNQFLADITQWPLLK